MIANYAMALLSLFICGIIIMLIILMNFNLKVKDKATFFPFICYSVFIWAFVTFFMYILLSPYNKDLSLKVHMFKFIGISFFPVFVFLHIRQLLSDKPISKKIVLLFCIIPIFTSIFAILDPYIHFMYKEYYFYEIDKIIMIFTQPNWWFYINTIYSYILGFSTLIAVLRLLFLIPKEMRQPILIMLFAILTVFCSNILYTFTKISFKYDITIITCTALLIFFYYTINVTYFANIFITSRDYIFNNISSMILVLDEKEDIIDCNKLSKELIKSLGYKPFGLPYESFHRAWTTKKDVSISKYDKNIISIIEIESRKETHYSISKKEIISSDEIIGYSVEIYDITKLYVLFRYLEETAYFDQLTGIYNRNAYNKNLEELSQKENLPLGILIGDVNFLKTVNDTKGHIAGDSLLKEIAKIIVENTPKKAFTARIGGDEFVALIPNTNEKECEDVIENITNDLSNHYNKMFGIPSIALGYAVMTEDSEDVNSIIKRADRRMYKNKNNKRNKEK